MTEFERALLELERRKVEALEQQAHACAVPKPTLSERIEAVVRAWLDGRIQIG